MSENGCLFVPFSVLRSASQCLQVDLKYSSHHAVVLHTCETDNFPLSEYKSTQHLPYFKLFSTQSGKPRLLYSRSLNVLAGKEDIRIVDETDLPRRWTNKSVLQDSYYEPNNSIHIVQEISHVVCDLPSDISVGYKPKSISTFDLPSKIHSSARAFSTRRY